MSACPSERQMDEFVRSGEPSADPLAAHLRQCASCRRRLDEIRENVEFLSQAEATIRRSQSGTDAVDPGCQEGTTHGDEIPGFGIRRVIGRGGQAIVYEAVQRSTGRRVALKVFLAEASRSAQMSVRFEREIALLIALRHPSIVTVYESGWTRDGSPYIAMEFIDGVPLDAWAATGNDGLGRGKRQSLDTTIELFAEICEALSHAHQHGVIHRDLKPSNILVDDANQPHIVDFGLAKALSADATMTLTTSGQFLGTLRYAAPEQLIGKAELSDTRTDVYALGIILYELLTERHPHGEGVDVQDLTRRIAHETPPPPSASNPAVGSELDTIVLKALAKEPDRRYHSAAELHDDIRRFISGLPISAKRDSTWYIVQKTLRRHRALAVSAGLALCALLAFSVIVTVLYGEANRARSIAASQADKLRAALARSNIERGRMAVRLGNILLAEQLLWREYLARGEDVSGNPANTMQPWSGAAYWGLWELYRHNPCISTARVHTQQITGIGTVPPGEHIISVSASGDIVRATRQEGRVLLEAGKHLPVKGEIKGATITSDGRYCVLRTGESVSIWNVDTPEMLMRLDGASIRFAPSLGAQGHLLAVFEPPDAVLIIKIGGQTIERVLTVADGMPVCLAFDDVGGRIAVGYADGKLRIYQIETGSKVAECPMPPAPVTACCFSRSGKYLALCGGQEVWLYAAPDWQKVATLRGHVGRIYQAVFTPTEDGLWTAGSDATIRSWSLDGTPIFVYRGHESAVRALSITANGRTLVSGDESGVLRWWEASPERAKRSLEIPGGSANSVAFSPDGSRLLVGGGIPSPEEDAGFVAWYRADSWDPEDSKVQFTGVVSAVAFAPDGERIAVSSRDGILTIALADQPQHTLSRRIGAEGNRIAFVPKTDRLVSVSDDGVLRLWDVEAGVVEYELRRHSGRVPSVDASSDSLHFATAGTDGLLVIWDARSGEAERVIKVSERPLRVIRFSPNGRMLAVGGDDGMVRIWDVSTGSLLRTLPRHRIGVTALAFHPTEPVLASGDRSGTVELWNLANWQNLATLEETKAGSLCLDLAFSPDGRYLAAAQSSAGVSIWQLDYYKKHMAGNLRYQAARHAQSE